MDYLVHKLTLDMHKTISQAFLSVKKGDTKRKLHITLTKTGKVYPVSGCTATFVAEKHNGDVLFNDCTIENGIIVYEFTDHTTEISGKMDCEIRLYDEDGTLISSPQFTIIVDGVVDVDGTVVVSNEFSTLNRLIAEANAVINNGGGGGTGGGTPELLIVHFDGEEQSDSDARTIHEHINSGGTVILHVPGANQNGEFYSLLSCGGQWAMFGTITDDSHFSGYEVDSNGRVYRHFNALGGTGGGSTVSVVATELGEAEAIRVNGTLYDGFVDHIARAGIADVDIVGTDIGAKCAEFAALFKGTDKVESFIFFSDPHLLMDSNYKPYPVLNDYEDKLRTGIQTLKQYYDATPTSFVVCGGDWLELHSRSEACFRLGLADGLMRSNFDRYYTAVGNHDHNANSSGVQYTDEQDVKKLTPQEVRNLMMRSEQDTYYSFDGTNTKFYVLDTGDEWLGELDDRMWAQVSWLGEKLKVDDAENSAIVMHIVYEANGETGELEVTPFASEVLSLCEAYNSASTIVLNNVLYDFTGCTGCMRFVLCGHKHAYDFTSVENGIPVVLTTNFQRESGTHTFNLCLADYRTNTLHVVRVGWGKNRTIEMAKTTAESVHLYPDENTRFAIGFDDGVANGEGYLITSKSTAIAFTELVTGVDFTYDATGEVYYAAVKPYRATHVSVTVPTGLKAVFVEKNYRGDTTASCGWTESDIEYDFQSQYWYYLLKFAKVDNSAITAADLERVSWQFSGTSDEAFTNQIRVSIDKDGSVYNGFGYKPYTRIGTGSGAEVEHASYIASGFIPAVQGDVVRVKNTVASGDSAISYWDSEFNFITAEYLSTFQNDGNGVLSLTITNRPSVAYIRFTGELTTPNAVGQIVTVNEEIV